MLGRKDYTKEEVERAKAAIDQQLEAYRQLTNATDGASSRGQINSALEGFEPLFCNNMTLVLDRYFVHRLRVVTGKDGNPLNEVELLAESLMNNDGVLRGNNAIKFVPDQSVLRLRIGDRIRLNLAQLERLAAAFLTELESKFVNASGGQLSSAGSQGRRG